MNARSDHQCDTERHGPYPGIVVRKDSLADSEDEKQSNPSVAFRGRRLLDTRPASGLLVESTNGGTGGSFGLVVRGGS